MSLVKMNWRARRWKKVSSQKQRSANLPALVIERSRWTPFALYSNAGKLANGQWRRIGPLESESILFRINGMKTRCCFHRSYNPRFAWKFFFCHGLICSLDQTYSSKRISGRIHHCTSCFGGRHQPTFLAQIVFLHLKDLGCTSCRVAWIFQLKAVDLIRNSQLVPENW